MRPVSSFAPHLGAALAAGLMLMASLAFNAGVGRQADQTDQEASARGEASDPSSFTWLSVEASTPMHTVAAAAGTRGEPSSDLASASNDTAPIQTRAAPRLAIIMDDVVEASQLTAIEALNLPITVSILPYAERAPDLARRARLSGLEVFLHLPMEPVGLDDPGPYALTANLDDNEIAARLAWAFDRVPGASGFNNHMGSRMTAEAEAMVRVFSNLPDGARSKIFVDSLTHPRSRAADTAHGQGLTVMRRDVFIDHERDRAAIDAQLRSALRAARQNGVAVAIAHPRPETFAALAELPALAQAAGVELVKIADLVAASELDEAPGLRGSAE